MQTKLPKEWDGNVIEKWSSLQEKHRLMWRFEMVQNQHGDIELYARRRVIAKDNIKLEIVHPTDFKDVPKVCAKIDSLDRKLGL